MAVEFKLKRLPKLNNITITNNTANYGGGMMLFNSSNPILENITISDNDAVYGGGVLLEKPYEDEEASYPILINSIIYYNGDGNSEIYIFSGEFVITYSDIQGGWDGEGNIDAEPIFTDPDNGDYTPMQGSLCIDAGDPFIWYNDIDGTRSDMGATGGLYATPNFTSHDFGSVGDFGSSLDFSLFNFRHILEFINSLI